jgi:hypothetical protein
MPSLLDVRADYQALSDLLDQTDGEITEENEPIIEALFEEIKQNVADKVDGYCGLLSRLESEKALAKSRKDQFAAAEKAKTRAIEFLESRLLDFGLTTQLLTCAAEVPGKKAKAPGKKIETTSGWTVGVQRNGGQSPLIIDEEFPEVDEEYLKYLPPVIDKEKVRAALEAGTKLPFASLGDRGVRLVIR